MNYDQRYYIYSRDFFRCQKCGKDRNQTILGIAHRIKQGKGTEKYIKQFALDRFGLDLKKYEIKKIIDHEDNMVVACNNRCNDSFNIFYKSVQRDELLEQIICKEFGVML
jgi:hypothetical protein